MTGHCKVSFFEKNCDKFRAVVRGGAEGALAPMKFGVSVKRTGREIDSLLITISTLRFENLITALKLVEWAFTGATGRLKIRWEEANKFLVI